MIPGLCSAFYSKSGRPSGSFSATTDAPAAIATGTGSLTTPNITAIPIGGIAPYTYQWNYVTGDPAIAATDPTSAATAGTATVSINDFITAAFECVVTDSTSATAVSNQVSFQFLYSDD